MDDYLNNATTSKIGSGHNAAGDKTDGKSNPDPEQKIKPRRMPKKWLGFTKIKWREIAAFAVLVPWIYNELFGTHNFGKLLMLAISLAISRAVVCSFFKSHSKGLVIWLFSLVPIACLVWINSKPIPESQSERKLDKLMELASNMPQSYPNLSADSINRIKGKLIKSNSKNVMVVIILGDSDKSAKRYAEQLNNVFIESGFMVAFKDPQPGQVIPAGLTIRLPSPLISDRDLWSGLLQILIESKEFVAVNEFGVNVPKQTDFILIIIGKN